MRLVRYIKHQEKTAYGIIKNDSVLEVEGDLASFTDGAFNYPGDQHKLDNIRILPPCEPSKVICLGLNYRSHAEEMKVPLPRQPILFMKPSTAVIGHDDEIIYPPQSRRVDYEAELAVVIGKKACRVPSENALDYVLGYTCGNDVTARDLQPKDGQWTYAKSFDTFSPLGPWIETGIEDTCGLEVRGYHNGDLVQSAPVADLIFSVPEIIAFISSCMTLLPGDVIMTGTPAGIGPLKPGDTFEVEITGVGKLRNTMKLQKNQ